MHSNVTKRVLIVSRPDADCKSLYGILKEYGKIDIAGDGQRALERIISCNYDLIVSEVLLPSMDGIELYKEAVALSPVLKSRFLFFTGSLARYYLKFFAEHDVPFLFRPMATGHVKDVVEDILNNTCCA